jgi:hypothetical protein
MLEAHGALEAGLRAFKEAVTLLRGYGRPLTGQTEAGTRREDKNSNCSHDEMSLDEVERISI